MNYGNAIQSGSIGSNLVNPPQVALLTEISNRLSLLIDVAAHASQRHAMIVERVNGPTPSSAGTMEKTPDSHGLADAINRKLVHLDNILQDISSVTFALEKIA